MPLDSNITYRADSDAKALFEKKCKSINKEPGDMHREIVDAFNRGSLRIAVSTETLTLHGELYVNEK